MSEAITSGERISLGFSGLFASAGDHIGHFYLDRQESMEVVVPFLEAGLAAGDKCVYLMQPGSPPPILDALRERDVDVDAAVAGNQFVIFEGESSVEGMQDVLRECIAQVREDRHFLRWAADMTWSLGKMPDSATLMEWESACNVVADPPAVFLCQYDLTRFGGDVVFDALKTHPLCVIGNAIRHNPYYENPERFLEELRLRAPRDQAD